MTRMSSRVAHALTASAGRSSREVIWCDDAGVTCRRWNWRQGPRTRLTEETTSGIFLLESLAPMHVPDVEAAATELAQLLAEFSPGARITVRAPHPER